MKYEHLTENEHFDADRIDDLDYRILSGYDANEISELYPNLCREIIQHRFEHIAKCYWFSDDEWEEVKN